MAAEIKVCPKCQQKLWGPTTFYNNELYHTPCAEELRTETVYNTLAQKYPNEPAKLNALLMYQLELIAQAKKQEKHLATIETIVIIAICLAGFGVLITACSALGLG